MPDQRCFVIASTVRPLMRDATFPFPSSPHWAPTMQMPGLRGRFSCARLRIPGRAGRDLR